MKKLLLVLLIIIVVVAGAYFGASAVVSMKLQNEVKSMKAAGYATAIAEVTPKVTPASREAARLILAAYDTILAGAGTGKEKSRELAALGPADSMDYSDDPALFQQIVDRYSAAIPLLFKAAEFPEVTFPFQYERGWAMSLDSIPLAVHTDGRLLRLYSKVCFAQGRTDEAVKALRAGIHLAAGIQDRFMLMTLVREMQLRSSFDLVRKFAPRLPAATLTLLQSDCAAAEVPGIYKTMLETEMALSQQAIITTGTWPQSELPGAGRLGSAALSIDPLRKYARFVSMATTRRQIELGAQPWYLAKPGWDRDSTRQETRKMGGPLGQLTVVNAHLFYARLERGRAENEITRLGLAVFRYHAEHGRWPDNLDAAGGEKLVDPYSGQPYVYRPGVNGFLLYSVGSDMKDDGGARSKDVSWQAEI